MSGDTILGIDPGTRLVGIAVVRSGVLVHRRIISLQGVWSQEKLYAIVDIMAEIIGKQRVTAVAVKVPDTLPASVGFAQLLGSLNVLCERYGIRPRYYPLSEIKARHCGSPKHNSKALMLAIVQQYPELLPEYRKEQRNKEAYYYKVFEALAAALMS